MDKIREYWRLGCLILGASSIFICLGTIMLTSYNRIDDKEGAMMICENLLRGGFVPDQTHCVLTGYEVEYIPIMFPESVVNYEYVTTGMQGFLVIYEVVDERTQTGTIDYALNSRWWFGTIDQDTVQFTFDDGVLVYRSISN